MSKIAKDTADLLKTVTGLDMSAFTGAYNIRSNCMSLGRQSTDNVKIDSKTDNPGLDIHIAPGTKGEDVLIPACVTKAGVGCTFVVSVHTLKLSVGFGCSSSSSSRRNFARCGYSFRIRSGSFRP